MGQMKGNLNMKKGKLLLILAATSLLASCGKTNNPEKSDDVNSDGKTVLLVGTYDGGLKTKWLEDLKKGFEEKYKDSHFEEGKTGVYVRILSSRSYNGTTLLSGSLQQDVYFTEDVNYYDHVNKGNFLNITDAVKGNLTEFNEDKTIESKLTDEMKSFLTSKDGNYYALPFYDGLYGFIYDYDLFEDKNLFFDSSSNFLTSKAGKKSSGPNGIEGDYDDGLPSTYDEFYKLMNRVNSLGMNPICHPGSNSGGLAYVPRTLSSFWSDFEGLKNFGVNYSLDGTVPLVSSINENEVTTTPTKIDSSNGYLLQKQQGKLEALRFLKTIVPFMKRNGDTQTQAQTKFIRNYAQGSDQYALLIDGAWWENEADTIFSNTETAFGLGRKDKRFGFLPIPKANKEKIGEKSTLLSQNNSFAFISSKTKYPELAKLFLEYAHTDVNLSAFTSSLSVTRALNYDLTEEDKTKATFYAKNLIELKKNSNVFFPVSSNPKVINNSSTFNLENWSWTSVINGKTYNNPYSVFTDSTSSSTTAEQYFDGLSNAVTKSTWDALK